MRSLGSDSLLLDQLTHHRPHRNDVGAVRAFLVFAQDGYLYNLGCTMGLDALDADVNLTQERLDAYKRALRELRASMSFQVPP